MSEQEEKSPSELLIGALEDFGESEPTSMMLIYTNQDHELVIVSSERRITALGLLAGAEHLIKFGQREE